MDDDLIIRSNYKTNIQLKFYSSYVSSKNIKNIVFDNVIMNYEKDTNKTETISVEL